MITNKKIQWGIYCRSGLIFSTIRDTQSKAIIDFCKEKNWSQKDWDKNAKVYSCRRVP